MRTQPIISFVILLLTATINITHADWQQAKGLYGGNCQAIIRSGSNMIAGTYETGIWLSTNNGNIWQKTSVTSGRINVFLKNNSDLFAGGWMIHKSSDNGITWQQLNLPERIVYSLASSNGKIYAGTQTYGVYSSTDNGSTWIQSTLNNRNIYALYSQGNNVFAGTPNGIFLSTDNGTTWNLHSLGGMSIKSITHAAGVLFTGTFENGLFRSTDAGNSWIQVNTNLHAKAIAEESGKLTAVTSFSDIYTSIDGGVNWNAANSLPGNLNNIISTETGLYISGVSKGIYRSVDNGLSWEQTPFINYNVSAFAEIGDNLFANIRGSYFSLGINMTTDEGTSWVYRNERGDAMCAAGDMLYAAFNGEPRVIRTTDLGTTWHTTGNTNADGWMSVISNGNTLFASRYVIQRSFDNGISWHIIPGISSSVMRCIAASGNLVFASDGPNSLIRSTNNGDNWSNVLYPTTEVLTIAINGSTVIAGTKAVGTFISNDNGATWTQNYFAGQRVNSVINHNGIFFATTQTGVYISNNNGVNWNSISAGLPETNTGSMIIHKNNIYVSVSDIGIWKRPIVEVVGIQSTSNEIPTKYNLSQNYPNPFNPTTKIKFSLPESRFTSLKVYDAAGRFIQELAGMELSAGTYETDFDASHLASGIFFYTLTTNDFTKTNRMVLVK